MAGSKNQVAHGKTCDALKRDGSGDRCVQPAGWGTSHVGQGRCRFHGGNNLVRHGRYSTIQRDQIRVLIEKHEQDPDPLNILPELAAARALFEDFIDRYEENTASLLAWHESFSISGRTPLDAEKVESLRRVMEEYEATAERGDELSSGRAADLRDARHVVDALGAPSPGKPRQVLDIADAYRIVSEITKIVERIEKIRAADAISRADLYRLVQEFARVVESHNSDNDPVRRLEKIKNDWLRIRLV
jgi:hypothetical protein